MVTYGVKLKIWSWRAWLRFFVVSMDLLYHVFIFSAIFSHKVSELNSKWKSEVVSTEGKVVEIPIDQRSAFLVVVHHSNGSDYNISVAIMDETGGIYSHVFQIGGQNPDFATIEIDAENEVLKISTLIRWWWYTLLKI